MTAEDLIDRLGDLGNDSGTKMMSRGTAKRAVGRSHVVADQIWTRTAVEVVVHPPVKVCDRLLERGRDGAGRVGIAEKLSE